MASGLRALHAVDTIHADLGFKNICLSKGKVTGLSFGGLFEPIRTVVGLWAHDFHASPELTSCLLLLRLGTTLVCPTLFFQKPGLVMKMAPVKGFEMDQPQATK